MQKTFQQFGENMFREPRMIFDISAPRSQPDIKSNVESQTPAELNQQITDVRADIEKTVEDLKALLVDSPEEKKTLSDLLKKVDQNEKEGDVDGKEALDEQTLENLWKIKSEQILEDVNSGDKKKMEAALGFLGLDVAGFNKSFDDFIDQNLGNTNLSKNDYQQLRINILKIKNLKLQKIPQLLEEASKNFGTLQNTQWILQEQLTVLFKDFNKSVFPRAAFLLNDRKQKSTQGIEFINVFENNSQNILLSKNIETALNEDGNLKDAAGVPQLEQNLDFNILDEKNTNIQQEAQLYYLGVTLASMLPGLSQASVLVDGADVTTNNDAYISLLQEFGLVHKNYLQNKDTSDRVMSGFAAVLGVFGLKALAKSEKVVSLVKSLKNISPATIKKVSEKLGNKFGFSKENTKALENTITGQLSVKDIKAVEKSRDVLKTGEHTRDLGDRAKEVKSVLDKTKQARLAKNTEGLSPEDVKLYEDSFLDHMTGIFNRGAYEFTERAKSQGKRIAIARYDGDHFKAFNDATSHEFGDFGIQIMGKYFNALEDRLRAKGYDVRITRDGGEEFTVVVTHGNLKAPEGELSKVLAEEMDVMSKDIKNELLINLSPEQKQAMAKDIYSTKYAPKRESFASDNEYLAASEKAKQQSFDEIGGSTIAVMEVDTAHLKKDVKVENIFAHADKNLEFQKNKTTKVEGELSGRGNIYIDRRSAKRTISELNNLKLENDLSETQNINVLKVVEKYSHRQNEQFFEKAVNCKKQIEAFARNSRQQKIFTEFLSHTELNPNKLKQISRQLYLAEDVLQGLRREFLETRLNRGSFTGAGSIVELDNLQKAYPKSAFNPKNEIEISPLELKASNEQGHIIGDLKLSYTYQEALLPAKQKLMKKYNIPEDAIFIAHRGGGFRLNVQDKYQEYASELLDEINALYPDAMNKMNRDIGKDKGKDFLDAQSKWASTHRQDEYHKDEEVGIKAVNNSYKKDRYKKQLLSVEIKKAA